MNKIPPSTLVGRRIRLAREQKSMTQEELAKRCQLEPRQIISSIENGSRAVSQEEMQAIIATLREPLDYFTDPYRIVDEAVVSFRASRQANGLEEFRDRVNRLAGAVLRFGELAGHPPSGLKSQLDASKKMSLEEAAEAGERVAAFLNLGPIPARNMEEAIQERLGILVLRVDAPKGISGAAYHLPEVDMIVINGTEAPHRQAFDLAHELFHLLTWKDLPPDRNDWTDLERRPKVEKLADSFAAGLLLPKAVMEQRRAARPGEISEKWILEQAGEMLVSGQCFYWRLVNLSLLREQAARTLNLNRLSRKGEKSGNAPLFNRRFVENMHRVLIKGLVSRKKAAAMIDLDPEGLKPLFAQYGLDPLD